MKKIVCTNCGNTMMAADDARQVTCDACGQVNVLRISDEQQDEEDFRKARFYQEQNEFDLAYRQYGRILDRDSNKTGAYWGQLMSLYGVEYVTDPATGQSVPTLHRNMPQSVLDCPAYRLTLEKADPSIRGEYVRLAQELRRIQLLIEEEAAGMDPFDIFICYKEELTEEEKAAAAAGKAKDIPADTGKKPEADTGKNAEVEETDTGKNAEDEEADAGEEWDEEDAQNAQNEMLSAWEFSDEPAGAAFGRTEDSYRARDIYYALTKEGYHVFYAPETLAEKAGERYEPIIFSALASAKLMLVIGTKKEYFVAPWVRNEWSRFLELRKQDRSRILIPVYRNFEDLPDELGVILEAQNIDTPGFQADLVKYVKETIRPSGRTLMTREQREKDAKERQKRTRIDQGYYQLREGSYAGAAQAFDALLSDGIREYAVIQGRFLASENASNLDELVKHVAASGANLNKNSWYMMALEAADQEEQQELEALPDRITEARAQLQQKDQIRRQYLSSRNAFLGKLRFWEDEQAVLNSPGDGASQNSMTEQTYVKQLGVMERRKTEILQKEGKAKKPQWWLIFLQLVLLLLPATIVTLYFTGIGDSLFSVNEKLVKVAAFMLIADAVFFIIAKWRIQLVLAVIWGILTAVYSRHMQNVWLVYAAWGVAVLSILATIFRQIRAARGVTAEKNRRRAYEKDLEAWGKWLDDQFVPYCQGCAKDLTMLGTRAGLPPKNRLSDEMELMERIQTLRTNIQKKLEI